MTILHISRMNFLSDKAHVYTTTKTCEALAEQTDTQVILLSSDNSLVGESALQSFFRKHNVKKNFEIISVSSYGNIFRGSSIRLVNWFETIAINISILRYIILHRNTFDILYVRDCTLFMPILACKYILKKPIFIELHAVLHKKHGQFMNNYFSKISDGLIAISFGLREYYKHMNPNIIVAFCAAAEPERFARIINSKEFLREELKLPRERVILMYAGNLYKTGNNDSYGLEDIVEAMVYVNDSTLFIGLGKRGNETKELEDLATHLRVDKKILFLPWVPKHMVYRYWKAADVLMLPSSGAQIGNSPTKMFEYLSSERVIIAARTKAIEEVLHHEKNALLVSDFKNPREWAAAINRVLGDHQLRDTLTKAALQDSRKYSWNDRGYHIHEFIKQTIATKS